MNYKKEQDLKENSPVRPFGMKDKLSYAAGDFGCNMSFALSGSIFAIFYNQYLGIETVLFGIILLILKGWDAINDPLIGALIDSSKPKTSGLFKGKFKRFIFIGSIGLVFSSALTFLPIPDAQLGVKIFVCILTYILWDISYTLANVPYGAMAATITSDSLERSQLSMWRMIGAMLANLPVVVILPIILYDDDDNLIGDRMIWVALILGIVAFFAFLFLLKATVERVTPSVTNIPLGSVPENVEDTSRKFDYIVGLKAFFSNKAAVGITLAAVSYFMGTFASATAITVLFQSYFENAQISGLVSIAGYLPLFFVIPFIPKLVKKYEKKRVSEIGLLISVFGSVLMIFLPISPDPTGILVYILCNLVVNFGSAFYMNISYAMVSDSIDYMEWKTGKRNEGMIYSMHSFFRKAAQGIGPAIVLFLMAMLGYVEVKKADQTFDTARNIRFLIPVMLLFASIGSWISMKFIYNIDKETMDEMESSLGRKK
ncbi:MAG: MFS transporter [archaeon]|nr:MFS transporter [archaeon]